MEQLIDIGVNLADKQFQDEQHEVIERAFQFGVNQMILTGSSIKSSKESLEIAKNYPNRLFSTAGIHPHDAKHFSNQTIYELEILANHDEVVAIGECGLDFNRMFSPQDIQEECFDAHLLLARKLSMPLFLHERDAQNRFCEIFANYRDLTENSVVHCFTGNEEQVKKYVSMGFYIGVTGWICDERRGQDLQNAVKFIPLNRLLIETDAPYLLPRNLENKPKNRRNEPAFLPHIVKEIAKYMGVTPEEVVKHSTANARKLFSLPDV
ncbi:MAG: YchF/TatD family DNA exonuclease [Lysinibacillus sp.]|nr:YchF/TatD family DNA exonuclease [Lysinibacillus sp.]